MRRKPAFQATDVWLVDAQGVDGAATQTALTQQSHNLKSAHTLKAGIQFVIWDIANKESAFMMIPLAVA